MITDEMLYAAAKRSCEVYLSHLERGYDPENQHEYPAAFERKIKKLQRRADHPVFYRSVQRAASLLLALLLAGGALLAVSPEARAAFVGWVKEVYETYFVYRFESSESHESEPAVYQPTWLPEGYSEVYKKDIGSTVTIVYSDASGKMLKYNYACNPNETDWYIDAEQTTTKNATVNGCPAQILVSDNSETASAILWTTGDNTAFYISGFLNIDELLMVAESIEKIK